MCHYGGFYLELTPQYNFMGTSHEDNLIRRRHYNETAPLEDTSQEIKLIIRHSHEKTTSQEEKLTNIMIGDEGWGMWFRT